MPRHAHSVLALTPLALLAACGGSSETAAPTEAATETPAVTTATQAAAAAIAYDCLPAHILTVAYDNAAPIPTATLSLDGASFVLSRIEAASGAKYKTEAGRSAGKTLIWWDKGANGILVEGPVGGPESDELTIAECSPTAPAG
jgi:membrane-bound inhibitor of C-type lysozyme